MLARRSRWLWDRPWSAGHALRQALEAAQSENLELRRRKPVSPSTLRRYLLPFRVYNVWAEQRVRNETPSLDAIAEGCAALGITAQHNKPLTTDYIAQQVVDFERRWQALIRHHAQSQQ
ncbi:hypothetical protein ACFY20_42240 [Streptomyces sp. NPDC001312]|uniref:hypothetical protein n=1 Tax=Streptomyces sp. NPDC001312 TaxID=3364561 RepID=UPI0036A0D13B